MDWLSVIFLAFIQRYAIVIMIGLQVVNLGWSIYKGVRDHERRVTKCGECGANRIRNNRRNDDR